MSLKIGITGGIGVGKTYCCKIFEILDIPIYYADIRAKYLMSHDEDVKEQILREFGEKSFKIDGTLNRAYLAEIIFNDPHKAQTINRIVHPAVGMDLVNWFHDVTSPYALYEAALMYESGSVSFLDKIIVVDAPLKIRIERVITRDNITKEEVMKRISKQLPQSEKVKKADYVIQNDGFHSIIKQIMAIHKELLEIKIF